jgi:hypothetical protein
MTQGGIILSMCPTYGACDREERTRPTLTRWANLWHASGVEENRETTEIRNLKIEIGDPGEKETDLKGGHGQS